MSTDRSDKVFEAARDAQIKFDYFMLGIVGALCAFIGQSFQAARIGINPSTLELMSLLMLFGAAIFGFLRIESMNLTMRLNAQHLRMQEERGMLVASKGNPGFNRSTGETLSPEKIAAKVAALTEVIPISKEQLANAQGRTLKYYKLRNLLLISGFLSLLGARVWTAYV